MTDFVEKFPLEKLEQERLAELEKMRLSGPAEIVSFSTACLEFDADQLTFDHEENYRVTALVQLKKLFKDGIKMEVMEEKVANN